MSGILYFFLFYKKQSRRPVKFEHQDHQHLHFNLICIDDILSLASKEQSRAVLIVEGDEDGWGDVAHLSFKFTINE